MSEFLNILLEASKGNDPEFMAAIFEGMDKKKKEIIYQELGTILSYPIEGKTALTLLNIMTL